jgi:serine/threonine-protein kinase
VTAGPGWPLDLGRVTLDAPIAAGGMATVHLGRLHGAAGFSLTVAIKRLAPEVAGVARFAEMLADEARLSARVRHPSVVPVLDVVTSAEGELFLVMEHVPGLTLAELLRLGGEQGAALPARVAASVVGHALEGLHAAHEARGEDGALLGVVHRDVSPQNILVGADGVARVLDFGVARAAGRVQLSTEGALKGKVQYMAPEVIAAASPSRASDVYAAGVVLWEALTGRRLFAGASEVEAVGRVLLGEIEPPSRHVPALPKALDAVVRRATATVPEARFATARDMSVALDKALPGATAEVSAWVQRVGARPLAERAALVAGLERAAPAAPGRIVVQPAPAAAVDVWKQLSAPRRPRQGR